MAVGSGNRTMNWVCLHLVLVLIFSANAVYCGTLVKSLPGFDGELPFKLYTGYVQLCKMGFFGFLKTWFLGLLAFS